MKPYYIVEFYSSGLNVELQLNHFPIITERLGYEAATTQVVNRWLGQRNNQVKLSFEYADFPTVQKEDDPPLPEKQEISIKLYDGSQTEQGMVVNKLLWQFQWPDQSGDKLIGQKIIEQAIDEDLPQLPITRLWQYSEKLGALTDQDKYDLTLLLTTIRTHFAQKQYDKAFQFFRYRYEDEEIADHIDQGAIKRAVLSMWQQYLPDKDVVMNTIKNSDIDFKLLNNGRVVQVAMTNGDFPIEFENKQTDTSFGIGLYCCKINGQWLVIR